MPKKKDDKDVGGLEPRFIVKGYWVDLISARVDNGTQVPSFVLSSGLDRNDVPASIVYFHNSTEDLQDPSFDPKRQMIYLHYPVSLMEVVLGLLKSGAALEVYYKASGKKVSGGIRLRDTLPAGAKAKRFER